MASMLRRYATLAAAFAIAASLSFAVHAGDQAPRQLKFASQSVGSTAYARTTVMAKIMNEYLPKGWSVDVQPISTGGVAGTLLTEAGVVDMAESVNVPNVLLRIGKYEKDGKPVPAPTRAVSILGGTIYSYCLIMFTMDFKQSSGCETLEEVLAKKIPLRLVTKAPGSAGEFGAMQLLDALGVNYNDIRSWGGDVFHVSPSQMADMLKEGKADISIDLAGLGQPAMTELTMTTQMHFPQLADATLAKLNALGYPSKIMPASSWAKQGRDIKTAVNAGCYVVDKDLPDEIVYLMVKAICENKAELVKVVPIMEEYDPTLSGDPMLNGLPLHPGALKYYKEVGFIH